MTIDELLREGYRRERKVILSTGPMQRWVSESGRVCVQAFRRLSKHRRTGAVCERWVYWVQRRYMSPSGHAGWDTASFHYRKRAAFKAAKRLDRSLGKAR